MEEIIAQITIHAPAEKVWQTLIDFPAYAKWDPFMISIVCKAEVGQSLRVTIVPAGQKAMSFKPTLTNVETNRLLQWRGKLVFPGIFDGGHRFEIIPNASGVTFAQSERFTGVLAKPFFAMIEKSTKEGFAAMNHALKEHCEK